MQEKFARSEEISQSRAREPRFGVISVSGARIQKRLPRGSRLRDRIRVGYLGLRVEEVHVARSVPAPPGAPRLAPQLVGRVVAVLRVTSLDLD